MSNLSFYVSTNKRAESFYRSKKLSTLKLKNLKTVTCPTGIIFYIKLFGVFQKCANLADTSVIPGLTRDPLNIANLRGLRVKPAMTD